MIVEMDGMTAWNVKKIVGRHIDALTRKISELEMVTPVDEMDATLLHTAIKRHRRERERMIILLESMKSEPNPYL